MAATRTLQNSQVGAIPPLERRPAGGGWTAINYIVFLLVILVIALALRWAWVTAASFVTAQIQVIHVATPQPTPITSPSGCYAVNEDCGEHVTMPAVPGIHSLVSARVAAPLRNPNRRFAPGTDSAQAYAELYANYLGKTITREEVESATKQMSKWIEEGQ